MDHCGWCQEDLPIVGDVIAKRVERSTFVPMTGNRGVTLDSRGAFPDTVEQLDMSAMDDATAAACRWCLSALLEGTGGDVVTELWLREQVGDIPPGHYTFEE